MIFGDKFYPTLSKLSPWRQSLFALTLAQRQTPNFALFADLENLREAKAAYLAALKVLWTFHQDKFNHIDLEKELAKIEPFIIEPEEFKGEDGEVMVGAEMAFNAVSSLVASFTAILIKEGTEAEIASKCSLSCAAICCEHSSDEILSEDELREMPLIDDEVNFQVSLMEALMSASRGQEIVSFALKASIGPKVSNVGISYEDAGLDLKAADFLLSADKLSSGVKINSAAQDCGNKKDRQKGQDHRAQRVPKNSKKRRRAIDAKLTFGKKQ